MSTFDTEIETQDIENLAKLAENVIYRVPGCTDTMVRKTLQDVYRDFCRRSCCLRGRRQFTLKAGQNTFNVAAKNGGVLDCVSYVKYNNTTLVQGRDYTVVEGNNAIITLDDRYVPVTDCPSESLPVIEYSFLEMPKINSEEVPLWFVQKYGDAIVSGVISKLTLMSGKPWSDASVGAIERIAYENAICLARIRYHDGGNNGSGDLRYGFDASDLI